MFINLRSLEVVPAMNVLVVAPHPDDETLGCGGTLLRLRRQDPKASIHWLIATEMGPGYGSERIARREHEIAEVAAKLGVSEVYRLGFEAATLDRVPMSELVTVMAKAVEAARPDTVFLPWRHDVHSDHRMVFDAAAACTKAFRNPYVRRMLAYETLSETDYGIDPGVAGFRPNVFVDISDEIEQKLALLGCYPGELGIFPFPRSVEAVTALARIRGAAAGVAAAEAFVLLKSVV